MTRRDYRAVFAVLGEDDVGVDVWVLGRCDGEGLAVCLAQKLFGEDGVDVGYGAAAIFAGGDFLGVAVFDAEEPEG